MLKILGIALLCAATILNNFGAHNKPERTPPLVLIPTSDEQWILAEDFIYPIGPDISVTVPRGFKTDLASIPRLLWPILPPHGRYITAAVVHDYLYRLQDCTREEADNILLIAMQQSQVSTVQQMVIYAGVRVGGWYAWRANRKERKEETSRAKTNGFALYCQLGNPTAVPSVLTAIGTNLDKPTGSPSPSSQNSPHLSFSKVTLTGNYWNR